MAKLGIHSVAGLARFAIESGNLSMSVGITECDPVAGLSLPGLLAAADRRMYEAKAQRAGRRADRPVRA